MTTQELAPLAMFDPLQNDPDDVVFTGVADGIPGTLFRPVAEAPWAISVGIAELHQYAGVSGGHKGVAVGCGGRETIAGLHHRDRVIAPGVALGQIDGNPFRAVVDKLGEQANCRLALVHVPAADCWLAGPPRAVIREAMDRMNPWIQVAHPAPGAVLLVPPAKSVSLYQASRAATYLALSPHPPLVPGATLMLDAACTEGLGTEAGFVAALQSVEPPWAALLDGAAPTGPGAQRAVMLAMLARRFRLEVVGCTAPDALRAVGIPARSDRPPIPSTWLRVPDPFQQLPQCDSTGSR